MFLYLFIYQIIKKYFILHIDKSYLQTNSTLINKQIFLENISKYERSQL